AEKTTAPEASEAASSQDDYYTRRAKSILKAERAKLKPHPLAASFPGMDVVVCEAGCPDRRRPEVVFMRRQVVAAETVTEGAMMPTSSDASAHAAAFSPTGVVCVAGCYGARAGRITPTFARH